MFDFVAVVSSVNIAFSAHVLSSKEAFFLVCFYARHQTTSSMSWSAIHNTPSSLPNSTEHLESPKMKSKVKPFLYLRILSFIRIVHANKVTITVSCTLSKIF